MPKNITVFMVWFSVISPYCFIIICSTCIDKPFGLPYCFKNINDVQKVIEDHKLAANSSFSVYKNEPGFNAKRTNEVVSFASYIFCTISIFFVINPD